MYDLKLEAKLKTVYDGIEFPTKFFIRYLDNKYLNLMLKRVSLFHITSVEGGEDKAAKAILIALYFF